jgi:hypothetical protein
MRSRPATNRLYTRLGRALTERRERPRTRIRTLLDQLWTNDALSRLAVMQGTYYAATGIWPFISMRTFEAVSGPKTDRWLVRTVGVLVSVIGLALSGAGTRGAVTREIRFLGFGSALGLGAVDVVYATRGRIARTYLFDAVIEFALATEWLRHSLVTRRGVARPSI